MKKPLSLFLALWMALALCACGESTGAARGEASDPAHGTAILTFDTADTGDAMYPAGATVSQCWTNSVPGLRCNVRTSSGSFQNVQAVAVGDADVALATADVVLDGYLGTGKFSGIGPLNNLRVIGAVYVSAFSAVSLRSRGLRYVHDLAGGRVSVGAASTATENASLAAFAAAGISRDNTALENLGVGEGANVVGDGILDAAVGFAALPIGEQINLATAKEIDVLGFTSEELDAILAGNAAYCRTVIPAGTYAGVDYDTPSFGVKCLLIVNLDADPSVVYELCRAMNEGAADMAAGNALLKDMNDPAFLCTQMPIPLHPGAARYYTEIGVLRRSQ